jgi:hypothetical protein
MYLGLVLSIVSLVRHQWLQSQRPVYIGPKLIVFGGATLPLHLKAIMLGICLNFNVVTNVFLGHGKNAISALEETLCKVSVYRLSYRLSRGRFVKINVVSVM